MHKILKIQKNEIKNLNLPHNKKIIISVGRFTKQKNFSYLLNEFLSFSKIHKDIFN